MPTYEYVCRECDHNFEVVQSFADDALTVCPSCAGPLRKVFSPAGIIFKGSGYYVNDSRAAPAGAGTGSSTSEAAGGDGGDTSATPKTDAPPGDSSKGDSTKGDAPKSDSPKSDSSTTSSPKPSPKGDAGKGSAGSGAAGSSSSKA